MAGAGAASVDLPGTLLGTTIRRSFVMGRTYVIIAAVYIIVISAATGLSSPASLETAAPSFLPILAVVGSMGGLMVFTNDRIKGVLEYLLAYGLSPRRLFFNVLVASLVLESVVLAFSLGLPIAILLATGQGITPPFLELVFGYAIPMSYASTAFTTTVGVYWTSLSSPRAGIGSPIGIVPIIGIAPPLVTLVAIGVLVSQYGISLLAITVPAAAILCVVVLALLRLVGRLMPRERLLSPA